jgi:hypothetical protein
LNAGIYPVTAYQDLFHTMAHFHCLLPSGFVLSKSDVKWIYFSLVGTDESMVFIFAVMQITWIYAGQLLRSLALDHPRLQFLVQMVCSLNWFINFRCDPRLISLMTTNHSLFFDYRNCLYSVVSLFANQYSLTSQVFSNKNFCLDSHKPFPKV